MYSVKLLLESISILQADWMFTPLLAHIQMKLLASHSAAVIRLGQHFQRAELC